MTSRKARLNIHGRWNWQAREHATGLIHGLASVGDDAITWCGQHIAVRWDNWTETPATSVVTCVRCVIR